VTHHVWAAHKEKVRENCLSKSGNMLYKFRQEKIERNLRRLKRAAWASLLPVTGIKESN
jgi:hypothetical protein